MIERIDPRRLNYLRAQERDRRNYEALEDCSGPLIPLVVERTWAAVAKDIAIVSGVGFGLLGIVAVVVARMFL